ncbi:MAG: hypothetical protein ACXWCV_06370 [Caldimonas sp.]
MIGFAFRVPTAMDFPTRPLPFLFALLAAALVAAGAAGAADKARKDAAAKPDAVLTPAQLRECVAQQTRLEAQTDDALKDKAAIERAKAEIARSEAALGEELASIDRTSAEAVDAYNAKVQARTLQMQELEGKVAAYNAKADTVKATKEGYAKSCGNRRYDERDLDDIKRKSR